MDTYFDKELEEKHVSLGKLRQRNRTMERRLLYYREIDKSLFNFNFFFSLSKRKPADLQWSNQSTKCFVCSLVCIFIGGKSRRIEAMFCFILSNFEKMKYWWKNRSRTLLWEEEYAISTFMISITARNMILPLTLPNRIWSVNSFMFILLNKLKSLKNSTCRY